MVRIFSIIALSAACILAVSARPAKHSPKPFSLPVRKRSHGTLKQTITADHKRLSLLSTKTVKSPAIIATNEFNYYTILISAGTPATTGIEVAFDTSTPFTIIPFFNTGSSSTCQDLQESASVWGDVIDATVEFYSDDISLGPYNFQQAFGVGTLYGGPNVIGFGVSTQDGSVVSSGNHIPSVMDNLVANNMVPSNVVGIDFRPVWNSSISAVNGEIDIGWIDHNKYSGSIAYTPLVATEIYSNYWFFNIPSIKFGGNTVMTDITAVVDAGVAMMWVSSRLMNSLFGSIPGGYVDSVTGLFVVPKSKVHLLQPITFTIGSNTITWSPSQYLVTSQQAAIYGAAIYGYSSNLHYLNIAELQTTGGYGMALGVTFIEDFYTVLDMTNQRIGFAPRK